MTLNSTITLLDSVFIQEVDDETILLDSSTEEYFSLNEVGSIFYNILKEEKNIKTSLKVLQEIFEDSSLQIEKDLLVFIKALEEKSLVVIT